MGKKRNVGIDALRLVAMFLVVVLHVLGQGGVLANSEKGAFGLLFLMESAALCAVNIYAMISGYVSYTDTEKKEEISVKYMPVKFVRFWLPVFFYSFGITLVAFVVNRSEIGGRRLFSSIFPITTYHYWYASSYACLFFLIPLLNMVIRKLSDREFKRVIFILFLLFSCYGTVARLWVDVMGLYDGYSFLWLTVLYVIGAGLKRIEFFRKIPSYALIMIFCFCLIASWGIYICTPAFILSILPRFDGLLVQYVSPTMVIMAGTAVLLFSRIKFGFRAGRIIGFLSPAAFGVYLIHVHNIIWNYILIDRFVWIARRHVLLRPVYVLLCAGLIFLFCILTDRVRIFLFDRFHIVQGAEKIVSNIVGAAERSK